MNLFKSIFQWRLLAAAALAVSAVVGLSSCNAFDEDLDPCPQGVVLRFIYDYNLEFANAFPSQVDCLTLLIYDAEGRYIGSRTETSDVLADENYRMTLDLPAGSYRFVAYGGLQCDKASFRYVTPPAEGSALTSLQVELNPGIADAAVGTNLHPLFYGNLDVTVPADATDRVTATLPMMKDTNNLRVVLQSLSGESLSSDDFEMYVTDNNTLMAWNNDVVPVSTVTYNPWVTGQVTAGLNTDGSELKLAYGEMSFPRLVTSNEPRLVIISRITGFKVVDIPLIDYLLALKSDVFAKMPAQEFLDRQSQWSMIFFLDKRYCWAYVQIHVNSWTVRINNTDLN